MLLSKVSLMAFLQEHNIKNETGEPLDFGKYRFMYEIYNDKSPLICCMKAAQIGFTTYEILKSAHECKNDRIDILYVLPTADDVKRFSGGKTNKIIAQNPILQTWTNDKDSIEQKQFGSNTIYYQGSWTERAALMITAKKLIVDEYDRCKQEIIEQYDSRLQSIADPKKAFFSNPSMPEFGIHKYYLKSDQKKWHIKHSCGKIYVMDETCIDYKRELYICPHCDKEITDYERKYGEWAATAEGEWSGYWIPLWIAPWMPAKKIVQMKKEKTPEFFANFVSGLPYINVLNMLTQATLEKNLIGDVNIQEERVIIGVDTGHNIHVTLANKQGIFFHQYIPSIAENSQPGYDPYDELEKFLIRYPRSVMVADQGGDLIGIRKLQAKYPGRVFLCWFTKETKNQEIIRWVDDEAGKPVHKVLVDRNRMVQMTVDEFGEQRLPIFGTIDDWQPWFDHAKNIYRVKEIQGQDENDPQYGWRWIWKRKGPDHFFFSGLYARIGLDRFAQDLAQVIKKHGVMDGVPRAGNFAIDTSYLGRDL